MTRHSDSERAFWRKVDRDAVAATAHPTGSTVSTVVYSIGGRSETVSGAVVGYRRGQVLLKTECHGTIVVPLDKIAHTDREAS